MNKQTGSVLAILLGVGILFAASTNRVGSAIAALRGTSPGTSSGDTTPDTESGKGDTPQKGSIVDTGKGVTKSLNVNGTTRFTQTGTVNM